MKQGALNLVGFEEFIQNEIRLQEEKENQQSINNKLIADALVLVPAFLQAQCKSLIQARYKNNIDEWRKDKALFYKLFSVDCRNICNSNFGSDDRVLRLEQKRKKLWACQLLGLINNTCHNVLMSEYQDRLDRQMQFFSGVALVNSSGKFSRCVNPQKKAQEAMARNWNIVRTMEKIADEKQFSSLFITLTAPPNYHSLPKFGKSKYDGKTPAQTLKYFTDNFAVLRSMLENAGMKTGEDFFGVQVKEGHKDSCLHMHIFMFVDRHKVEQVKNIIYNKAQLERVKYENETGKRLNKLQWQIKENNGSAKFSTYVFKYLVQDTKNKNTLSNKALLSHYGGRQIQWFGFNSSITLFQHICNNYLSVKDYVFDVDVLKMLEDKDLYSFIKNHRYKFRNIRIDGKFLGVGYTESNREILIETDNKALFEVRDDMAMCEFYAKIALTKAIDKQLGCETRKQTYVNASSCSVVLANYGEVNKISDLMLDDEKKLIESVAREQFDLTFSSQFSKRFNDNCDIEDVITVIPNYSSKKPTVYLLNAEIPILHPS